MTTVVTVLIALVGIWLGTLPFFVNIVNGINSLAGDANGVLYNTPYGPMQWSVWLWGIGALVFCYLGSVLPIWRFAQPVNYTSFWFVALGILGSIIGILIATFTGSVGTSFEIPAFVAWNQPHLGWLWPILFVTISCGAVSGWHSLVSTSGTARQLEKETDALPVGAGAMFTDRRETVASWLAEHPAEQVGDTARDCTARTRGEHVGIFRQVGTGGAHGGADARTEPGPGLGKFALQPVFRPGG